MNKSLNPHASNRTYLSPRGHLLLYVGEPIDKPIITLENYTKWYEIYLIKPEGAVEKVDNDIVLAVLGEHRDAQICDHVFHPRLLYRVAQELEGELEERAAEVAAGRWMLEVRETDDFNFSDPAINS